MPRRRSALGLGADVKGCGCCGRCRLFFGDLKALLLKRPASAASDPGTADGEDDAAQAAVATAAALLAATTSLASMVAAAEASGAAEESVLCGQGADAESLASGNTGTRTPLCRICFQGPEKEELLNPCRCNGSVRWTHQPCLLTWISERGSWSCELCYYKYHVRPVSTKHPAQWQGVSLSPIERVQTAAVALGCLFLLASLVWLVWSGLSPAATWQRRDVLFQVCYALYGLMDIVCIGLLVHEGPAVYRIMKRWRAMNQRWKVLNYNKDGDLQGKGGGGRSVLGLSAFSPLRFHFGMLFLHLLERFGSAAEEEEAESIGPQPELVMRVTTV